MLDNLPGRQSLLATYRDGLLGDTLEFWFPRAIDEEHGGFLHYFDRDGRLFDTDKSVWAQGRMSWLLLELYNTVDARPEWLRWAQGGIQFLERHCFDDDGRMFFHVTRDGRPLRKRRYAYSEAFAAIAYAALYRATRENQARIRAIELFEQFTDWNFTPGLMPSKSTDVRPMIGLAPRMITIVTAQELRQNLGDATPAICDQWIDRAIDEIDRLLVKRDLQVVLEAAAPDGTVVDHVDGRQLNPGHAIEGAWFIMREGSKRGDQCMIELGLQMLDWMWNRGWDQQYGGMFYFRDLFDHPPQEYWHDMKFWWPHNETIIATLMAYELTGDIKYARWHQLIHDWSLQHFRDPEHGEWFGYLHRDGRLSSSTKGNLWKSCFHLPRMQLVCWQLLKSSKRG